MCCVCQRTRTLCLLALLALGSLGQKSWADTPAAKDADDGNIFYNRRDDEFAALFLSTFLTKNGVDERGLPLMMRLPTRIRSALVNMVPSWTERGYTKEACDKVLLHLLQHDPNVNIRCRAANLWGANRAEAIPVLLAALKDPAADVRLMVCQRLGFGNVRESIDAMLPLLDDKSPDVRDTAVRALGMLEAGKALPKVRELYQKAKPGDNNWVYAGALAKLGDYELAMQAADSSLDSANWNARHQAALALADIKSKTVVPFLIKCLPREMAWELKDWKSHGVSSERTLELMCQTLADRTGTKLGSDAGKWHAWWKDHHRDYGVPTYQEPKDFPDVLQRYQAPRELKPSSNLPRYSMVLSFTTDKHDDKSAWSKPVDGLQIRLVPLQRRYRPHANIDLMLMMQNASTKPIARPHVSLNASLRHPQFGHNQRMIDNLTAHDSRASNTLQPMEIHLVMIQLRVPHGDTDQKENNELHKAGDRQPDIEWRKVQLIHPLPPGRYDLQISYTPDSVKGGKNQPMKAPPIEITVGE